MKLRPAAATSISTSLGLGIVRGMLRAHSVSRIPGRGTSIWNGGRSLRVAEPDIMRGRRGHRHQPVHVSQVAVQGDLVLVVAVAQFLDEGVDLLARAAGQIDQPAMQVLVFTDRDPAQSPQRRLRQLDGSRRDPRAAAPHA